MKYGYWLPVFGGWLRNVEDEQMEASWAYARHLAIKSEQWGYDLTLVAELHMNDIKGISAPALDAWSPAAALAAVTTSLELLVAVRPNFHQPAAFAKMAANIAGDLRAQAGAVTGDLRWRLRERIEAYEDAGLDLLLLQMSPQAEMERFAAQVMRRAPGSLTVVP